MEREGKIYIYKYISPSMNEGNSYWFLIYFLPAEFSPWIMPEFLYCIGWGLRTAKSFLVEQIASLNWITEGAKKLWCHALCLLHVWLNKYWFQIFHTLLPRWRRTCCGCLGFLAFFFFFRCRFWVKCCGSCVNLCVQSRWTCKTHTSVCRVCVTTDAWLTVQSEGNGQVVLSYWAGRRSIQSGI